MTQNISDRKIKHLQACLLEDSQYKITTTGFENVCLPHRSLAEINFAQINLNIRLLNKELDAPIMIAPMTGGAKLGGKLNELWAKCAQKHKLAMSVGSLRVLLKDKDALKSFDIRKHAPNILLFGNIGAVSLNREISFEKALELTKIIGADGIMVHINPLQEVCQEDGDTDFSFLVDRLKKAKEIFLKNNLYFIVREVGFGFSNACALKLKDIMPDAIDCAGAGGTSWTRVEGLCTSNHKYKSICENFYEYGIPTKDSILNIKKELPNIPLIATGGIRSGVDILKSLYLGADIASLARPFLLAAMAGEDTLDQFVVKLKSELKIAMFSAGFSSIDAIKKTRDNNNE